MQGHGSASSEGVAADVGWLIAVVVEADGLGGGFQHLVDVVGCDMSRPGVEGVVDGVDGGVGGAVVAHDVGHSARQRPNRAVLVACAVMVDGLAFDAVLLSGDDHSGRGGLVEVAQWGRVGDDLVVAPKDDVFDCKWHSVSGAAGSSRGVLANSKEVVKSYVAEVSSGFGVGTGVSVLALLPVGVLEVGEQGQGDCQLGHGWGVLAGIASELVF